MTIRNLELIKTEIILGREINIYGDLEEPLFLAKDVAKWIDYSEGNINRMLENVDEDEKVKIFSTITFTPNCSKPVIAMGSANRMFLTEDGIYEVMMFSRKPIAKQMKKVVKDLLKSLRRQELELIKGKNKVELSEKDTLALKLLNGQATAEDLKRYSELVGMANINKNNTMCTTQVVQSLKKHIPNLTSTLFNEWLANVKGYGTYEKIGKKRTFQPNELFYKKLSDSGYSLERQTVKGDKVEVIYNDYIVNTIIQYELDSLSEYVNK